MEMCSFYAFYRVILSLFQLISVSCNLNGMDRDGLSGMKVFFNFAPDAEIWEDDNFYEVIYYWSYVRSASFEHKGGPISYGVTNIGSVAGIENSPTPAWRFSLREIKIVEDK